MEYIVWAFGWFIVSSIIHIALIKARLILGISRSLILGVFILGFIGCIVTIVKLLQYHTGGVPLPLTSILLYCGCTLAYASLTASPTLGDKSPTTQLLLLLDDAPKTEKQIRLFFVSHDVIQKRLHDLEDSGCIKRQGSRLYSTVRGKQLASVIFLYRKILGLRNGG